MLGYRLRAPVPDVGDPYAAFFGGGEVDAVDSGGGDGDEPEIGGGRIGRTLASMRTRLTMAIVAPRSRSRTVSAGEVAYSVLVCGKVAGRMVVRRAARSRNTT
jgi:hypothetical protein